MDQNNNIPKFVFFGTPYVASDTLEILFSHGIVPSLIVTSPDRPSGRGMKMTPTPVKLWAEDRDIPILQPDRIDTTFYSQLSTHNCTLALVVAYGKILPQTLIESFPLGVLNIHYSLLPKYRGASPVETALLQGDTETGVAIQKMVFALDAGDIVAIEKTKIYEDERTPELRARLIKMGGELLAKVLPEYVAGRISLTTQDHTLATKCGKIKKEDGDITHETNDAIKWNKYRAYAEWPRTYFFLGSPERDEGGNDGPPAQTGKRIIISDAAFENEKFVIKKIIPEGKKEMEYKKAES